MKKQLLLILIAMAIAIAATAQAPTADKAPEMPPPDMAMIKSGLLDPLHNTLDSQTIALEQYKKHEEQMNAYIAKLTADKADLTKKLADKSEKGCK
jgi:hypothetical protein